MPRELLSQTHSLGTQKDLAIFAEHLTPLGIIARGDVLVIGPGQILEEVYAIEEDIASGQVKSILIIGANPDGNIGCRMDSFKEHYPNLILDAEGIRTDSLFNRVPLMLFDTIIFIGLPLRSDPEDEFCLKLFSFMLREFAEHLNPGGVYYGTINYVNSETLAVIPPENCKLQIIKKLTDSPKYGSPLPYAGIVMSR